MTKSPDTDDRPILLEVRDVVVHYGRIQALHGVSLIVREGELVTLLGSNGAGKTTTMRAISGLRPLTSGSVWFEGNDISRVKAHRRVADGLIQAPEGRGIFPGMTIGRALMARPKVLLLDEPSMGLAPMVISQIFKIIADINAQGTTVLLVEQNAQQALTRSDRAYILETGEITREGNARALLADDSIRAAYLGVA